MARPAKPRLAKPRLAKLGVAIGLTAGLVGCGPDYSPNTYASSAVQQANKVEQGVVVGIRLVDVSASGATGAVAGGAAGGIAGSQLPGSTVTTAIGALGGTLIGGLVGSGVDKSLNDTSAYEYIVRKPNNELVSVTQRDAAPIAIGAHVLVIAGNQARIVPDYTVPPEPKPEPKVEAAPVTFLPPAVPVASEPLFVPRALDPEPPKARDAEPPKAIEPIAAKLPDAAPQQAPAPPIAPAPIAPAPIARQPTPPTPLP